MQLQHPTNICGNGNNTAHTCIGTISFDISQNHLLKSTTKIRIMVNIEVNTILGDTFWNDDDGMCDDVIIVVDGLVEYLIEVDIFFVWVASILCVLHNNAL